MNSEFRLDKNDGQYIGSTKENNPKNAAFNILSFALAKKGREVKLSDIEVTQIDEKTFEVKYANYEFILSKND